MDIRIDIGGKKPIYRQLLEQIENDIREGRLLPGSLLPSMNELADSLDISRETVKKSYGILRDRGFVVPQQGKGFYVADRDAGARPRILVLFDKFSIYKQILYNSIAEEFGPRAELTVLTHDQSLDLFAHYLDMYLGAFDYYIVIPHFPLDAASQGRAAKLVSRIPYPKLVLVDYLPEHLPGHYGAVYQDFEHDVCEGLRQGLDKLRQTAGLHVITLPTSLYGPVMRKGIARFCEDNGIPVRFSTAPPERIEKGETFLILNSQLDWGLAALARRIKAQGLAVGEDVFVIAYNDVDLNEVVLGGLTTVSTDFRLMGRTAARMILDRRFEKIHCPFRMNRRSTF